MRDFFVFIGMHDNDSLELTFIHKGVLIDMLSWLFVGDLQKFIFELCEFLIEEWVIFLLILKIERNELSLLVELGFKLLTLSLFVFVEILKVEDW